jgi:hypothetical protein
MHAKLEVYQSFRHPCKLSIITNERLIHRPFNDEVYPEWPTFIDVYEF